MSNGVKVSIDEYGFRNSSNKIDSSKPSWLLLGDSVTFGIGVEDDSTFSAIISSAIDTINTLNPSAIGYNIISYWNVLKYLIIENEQNLNINRVTLLWCLNDLYIDVSDIETPGGNIRYILSDLITYFRVNSRLYHLTKSIVFDRPKAYFMFDKLYYNSENQDFKKSISIIYQMKELCNNYNIKFDIILLPYEYQLRNGEFTPQSLMIDNLVDKINIYNPFLTPVNTNQNPKIYYLYGDGIHFSNYGHKFIAKKIIDINAKL